MGMHTNGPEHHDCARCGCRITNQPRVTTAEGILCVACHQARERARTSDLKLK